MPALPGEHYCLAHQGNHSHYAEHNCTVCKQAERIKELEAARLRASEAAHILNDRLAEAERQHVALHNAAVDLTNQLHIAERQRDELQGDLAAMTECAMNHDAARTRYQLESELAISDIAQRGKLAELAAQNQKLREVLKDSASDLRGYECHAGAEFAEQALALPDLASPVLNRVKAEALREAADKINSTVVRTVANSAATVEQCEYLVRVMADAIEKGEST